MAKSKKFELYSEVEMKLVFMLVQYEKDTAWKEKELLKMLDFMFVYSKKMGKAERKNRVYQAVPGRNKNGILYCCGNGREGIAYPNKRIWW